MAHRIISDEALLAAALDLFRTYGFEGVSIKHLADATGLEKASLYYRFPGGKDEIAMAVAKDMVRWFEESVFAPLRGPGPVRKRMTIAAERLREFYVGGTKACLTDVLSLPGGSEDLHAAIQGAMRAWIEAFTQIARESGMSPAAARHRAEEAVLRVEGSLVVSRVLGDTSTFERTIRLLPDLLTVAA